MFDLTLAVKIEKSNDFYFTIFEKIAQTKNRALHVAVRQIIIQHIKL